MPKMTDVFSGYSTMFDNNANPNSSVSGASLPVNSHSNSTYSYQNMYNSTGNMIGLMNPNSCNIYAPNDSYSQGSLDINHNHLPNQNDSEFNTRSETIHSGHFMVSEIDDTEGEPLDQSAEDVDTSISPVVGDCKLEMQTKLIDNTIVKEQGVLETAKIHTYVRSATRIRIDNSLSKLFQCMSLAYESKLTSPKWKTFKGLKLKLRDKIRLNNMIWRAWHMQYIVGCFPPICQFSSKPEVEIAQKPESIVLEGKYWKWNSQSVITEYKKWRMYHKERNQSRRFSFSELGNWTDLGQPNFSQLDDDFNFMDFSDASIFNTLLPPISDFPNPREIARSGIGAEFIQPGLTTLQPSFEDFMDTFDPTLQGLLSMKHLGVLPTLEEEGPGPETANVSQIQNMSSNPYNNNTIEMTQNSNSTNYSICDGQINYNSVESNNTLDAGIANSSSNTNDSMIQVNARPSPSSALASTHSNNQMSVVNNNLSHMTTNNQIQLQAPNTLQLLQSQANIYSQSLTSNVEQSDSQRFAVPKQPSKTRTRSRSVNSLPVQMQQQQQIQTNQVPLNQVIPSNAPLSMNRMQTNNAQMQSTSNTLNNSICCSVPDCSPQQSTNSTHIGSMDNLNTPVLERSNSLPVYQNRRNAIGPMMNAQLFQQRQTQNPGPYTMTFRTQTSPNTNQLNSVLPSMVNNNSIVNQMPINTGQVCTLDYSNTNAYQTNAMQSMSSDYSVNIQNSKYISTPNLPPPNANLITQLLSSNEMCLSNQASNANNSNFVQQQTTQPSSSSINASQSMIHSYKRNSTGTFPAQFQYNPTLKQFVTQLETQPLDNRSLSSNNNSLLINQANAANNNHNNTNTNNSSIANSLSNQATHQLHSMSTANNNHTLAMLNNGMIKSRSSPPNTIYAPTNQVMLSSVTLNNNQISNNLPSTFDCPKSIKQQSVGPIHHVPSSAGPIKKSEVLHQRKLSAGGRLARATASAAAAGASMGNVGLSSARSVPKLAQASGYSNSSSSSSSSQMQNPSPNNQNTLPANSGTYSANVQYRRCNSTSNLVVACQSSTSNSNIYSTLFTPSNAQVPPASLALQSIDQSKSNIQIKSKHSKQMTGNNSATASSSLANTTINASPSSPGCSASISPSATSPSISLPIPINGNVSLNSYVKQHSTSIAPNSPSSYNAYSMSNSPNLQVSLGSSPVSSPVGGHMISSMLNNSHSGPSSPVGSTSSLNNTGKSEQDRIQYREHRRVCHINAEQKRRCNIKNGFDTLRAILPSISSNCNTKISKAAMLQKGAEHIRMLRIEREQQKNEAESLRAQIESLNQTIGIFQNQLPATGAPVTGMRPGQFKEKFDNYVREKTLQNWKFWMFSIIMEPLLESYNNTVPTTNIDEMCSSVMRWLDQNCNLINLRRDVLNSLRVISTSTNVLTNPQTLSEESLAAVKAKIRLSGNSPKPPK